MDERIDLSQLDIRPHAERGAELQLKHPVTGDPLKGWVLQVRGYDSETYQRTLDEQLSKQLDRLARGRRKSADEVRVEELELDAALIAGWPATFDLEGRPFPYSEGNACALLRRFSWIREQASRFAVNRENFLPGPASS